MKILLLDYKYIFDNLLNEKKLKCDVKIMDFNVGRKPPHIVLEYFCSKIQWNLSNLLFDNLIYYSIN